MLGKSFNLSEPQKWRVAGNGHVLGGKRQVAVRKPVYVSILGKLSKETAQEKDLISKAPVTGCYFASHLKYLFPPHNFVFSVLCCFPERAP